MSKVAVVEFIGPPGCGKTTLTRLVQDSLGSLGYRCLDAHANSRASRRLDRLRTLVDAGQFYIQRPALLIGVARFAAALRSADPWVPRIARIILKQAYMVTRMERVAEAKGCDVVIFDQSIMQSIWSMLVSSKELPEKELRRLLSTLRRHIASVVIQCQLESKTAHQRMMSRESGWSRFADMDADAAISLLDDRLPYFAAIARLAQAATGCTVMTVDTRRDMFTVRDEIVRFLVQSMHQWKGEETQHVQTVD